jgi:hypothetical protein
MNAFSKIDMGEVTRLTQAGKLAEAMALLQGHTVSQPLSFGLLRVAQVVVRVAPTKSERSSRRVAGDAQFSCAARGCDPATLASAMAVPDHKETRRVPAAAVIAAQRFVNVFSARSSRRSSSSTARSAR